MLQGFILLCIPYFIVHLMIKLQTDRERLNKMLLTIIQSTINIISLSSHLIYLLSFQTTIISQGSFNIVGQMMTDSVTDHNALQSTASKREV